MLINISIPYSNILSQAKILFGETSYTFKFLVKYFTVSNKNYITIPFTVLPTDTPPNNTNPLNITFVKNFFHRADSPFAICDNKTEYSSLKDIDKRRIYQFFFEHMLYSGNMYLCIVSNYTGTWESIRETLYPLSKLEIYKSESKTQNEFAIDNFITYWTHKIANAIIYVNPHGLSINLEPLPYDLNFRVSVLPITQPTRTNRNFPPLFNGPLTISKHKDHYFTFPYIISYDRNIITYNYLIFPKINQPLIRTPYTTEPESFIQAIALTESHQLHPHTVRLHELPDANYIARPLDSNQIKTIFPTSTVLPPPSYKLELKRSSFNPNLAYE